MLKMHVKPKPDALDECLADMANIDVEDLYCSADPLLSDDIWKKFELDFPLGDLSSFDDIFGDLDAASIPDMFIPSDLKHLCEIRNHDCMWAGHCGSKEHPTDEARTIKINNKLQAPTAAVAPGPEKTPAIKQQPVAAGRSLLLKTVMKAPPAPVLPSPDSPPISDDEETKGQTSTLKMLNDAIDECDIDEDSDLCEYFEEGEDIVVEPEDDPSPPPKPKHFTPESDHCYHKDKNASMRMANLGIETPSDSEEEIDVVSVAGEKHISSSKMGYSSYYALPTNPSSQDRQQLERTVDTAITKKRIRTLPPVRKSSSSSGEHTPTKKRMPEARGVKRSKHQYNRSSTKYSPYKRRAIQPSTGSDCDSEPELEKRSLHNNMERQRRVDLRNAFEDLRVLVPKLSVMERAAKVQILKDARDYCYHLSDVSENQQKKVQDLRKQQERLRARVSQLRRSLAAKR